MAGNHSVYVTFDSQTLFKTQPFNIPALTFCLRFKLFKFFVSKKQIYDIVI